MLFFSFNFKSAKSENQQGVYDWVALLGTLQPGNQVHVTAFASLVLIFTERYFHIYFSLELNMSLTIHLSDYGPCL